MRRVVLLSNFPVPYQLELLRAVKARGELVMNPFFLEPRDPARSWPEADAPVLPSIGAPLPPELRLHPTLLAELYAARPELAIVCGYSYATFQLAIAALSAARIPVVLWAEEPRLDQGSAAAKLVRRALLLPLHLLRGVLAVGTRAAGVWQRLLGPKMPVIDFPYSCDLDRYLCIERPPRDTFTWLFSGQLTARKGIDLLVDAFAIAAERDPKLRLLVAGEGPERGRLPSHPRVEWLGFVPWEELPQVYARADALVVPSRHDGWALVVNEAFGAGLPVLASDAVGAAIDLVKPGETGLLVPAGQVAPLAEALIALQPDARRLGHRARQVARQRLTPDKAAERLGRIVAAALR